MRELGKRMRRAPDGSMDAKDHTNAEGTGATATSRRSWEKPERHTPSTSRRAKGVVVASPAAARGARSREHDQGGARHAHSDRKPRARGRHGGRQFGQPGVHERRDRDAHREGESKGLLESPLLVHQANESPLLLHQRGTESPCCSDMTSSVAKAEKSLTAMSP
jgi:hypothetical protein